MEYDAIKERYAILYMHFRLCHRRASVHRRHHHLTSTCCRTMERIINNQLLDYLLSNQLISIQQHGFIRKRGTCTNILESLHD